MSSAHAHCTVRITQATHITKYTVYRQISLLKRPKEAVLSDHEKRFNSLIMHPRVHPSSFHPSLLPFLTPYIFTYIPPCLHTYLPVFLPFILSTTRTHTRYIPFSSTILLSVSLSILSTHTHTAHVSLYSVNLVTPSHHLPTFPPFLFFYSYTSRNRNTLTCANRCD